MSPAQHAAGRPPFLDAVQNGLLRTAVNNSTPREHRFASLRWSGPIVKRYIEREFHKTMTVRHCQRLLKEIRGTNF